MGQHQIKRRRRGLSRREFLAGSAAIGLAAGAPTLLLGCGDGSDAPPPPPPTPGPGREMRTLHFDFSFAEIVEPRLVALASPHHRAALREHTAQSRADHRRRNAALANVPDERLTHYIEDVDLPADAFQTLWMTGTHADSGAAALLGFHLHVPAAFAAQRRARLRIAGQRPPASAKMRAYGIATGRGDDLLDLFPAVDDFHTPFDTAVALIFHHPEIMNLDPERGTSIVDLIQTLPCSATDPSCTPFIGELAFRIATHWPATSIPGGWATLVQISDANGTPAVDDQGEPRYRYDLTDETVAAAARTVREVLKTVFNDAQYEGTNWHATQGRTVAVSSASADATIAGQAAFAVAAEHPGDTTVHGVNFRVFEVVDAANRTVEVQLKHRYLRYLGAYVQFADEAGDLPFDPSARFDTGRAAFLQFIFTNDTVLGIPLTGELVETQRFRFNVPAEASKARLYFGGLGLGGAAFCPEAMPASIATIAFNIGVPAMLLAIGAAVATSQALKGALSELLFARAGIFADIVRAVGVLLITDSPNLANGIFGTAVSDDAGPILISLGNTVLQALLSFAPQLSFALFQIIGADEILNAMPVIGIASRLTLIAADLAALGQTVGEVLSSPALFTNTLSLTMTTTVIVNRDPDDFQFPARARRYTVTLTYDQASSQAHKQSGAIAPGQVDPISVVFDAVPSGGMVQVEVVLTTDDDFIVGTGSAGPLAALPETAGTIPVTIAEVLIPLTRTTRYEHVLKLTYQDERPMWVETGAPTATRSSLCQGQENALCALNGITVHTRSGHAGYGFQAGGQNVPLCGDASTGGTLHMVQNVFLGRDPNRETGRLPCGFLQPVGIVYDPLGPSAGVGRHFFLQPTPSGFLVQAVLLNDAAPFDNIDDPEVWGRFTQPLDSLAVHPAGYVVGVSRENHKMEILQLPAEPANVNEAPQAVPFAFLKSGEGDRPGLMRAPVAVVVSDNAILVLEDGNARIQAFDVNANPVLRFKNGTTSIVELQDSGPGVVYLDLGVEALGYLYVLSYVNDGLAADDYRLDLYTPDGDFLARTTGVAAARLAVDAFRNVYTLNYETIAGAPRVEPSLSQWEPSTPNVS